MVYDTLLATDANFKVQPQMADWRISDDKLTYTFTLRDGLKWHDGVPVTAEDCIASLRRWGKNDGMGQKLMEYTASLEATDAKTIVLKLREPYGLVLESIAKPSSYVPFMMPRRLAETPGDQQITQQIGSCEDFRHRLFPTAVYVLSIRRRREGSLGSRVPSSDAKVQRRFGNRLPIGRRAMADADQVNSAGSGRHRGVRHGSPVAPTSCYGRFGARSA
jgi:hypothetical protein